MTLLPKFSPYTFPHHPLPASAWGPDISFLPNRSEWNWMPLLPSFGTSLIFTTSRKSPQDSLLVRNSFCFRPFSVLPTSSPLSTDHRPSTPFVSQLERSLPLNRTGFFSSFGAAGLSPAGASAPAGRGTWAGLRRYATRSRTSSLGHLSSNPSGIIDKVLGL